MNSGHLEIKRTSFYHILTSKKKIYMHLSWKRSIENINYAIRILNYRLKDVYIYKLILFTLSYYYYMFNQNMQSATLGSRIIYHLRKSYLNYISKHMNTLQPKYRKAMSLLCIFSFIIQGFFNILYWRFQYHLSGVVQQFSISFNRTKNVLQVS